MTMKRERCHQGRGAERTTALAAALIIALASPVGLDAQANTGTARNTDGYTYLRVSQTCQEGVLIGQLGISGLNCRGECSITLNEAGNEQYWSFTTEPMITGVKDGSPADGALETGDILVAIDGIPITTAEGGHRFANVEPGEEVTLLVRRNNIRHEVTLEAAADCRPVPNVVAIPTRLPSPPSTAVTRRILSTIEAVVAPRVRVQAVEPAGATEIHVVGVPRAWSILPRGKLGFSFSCGPCSSSTDPETGETIWSFSGPVEVIGVTPDGPADLVGIERGDVVTTIGIEPIESEEGGISFSRLVPGEAVDLTVVKRSGEEVEVTVIPVASDRVVVTATAAPTMEILEVEPFIVEAIEVPPHPPEDPERMILRFSGTVGPAEIEVRGGPVDIVEQKEEGIITVITGDTRIQIRVPRNWRQREDGANR